MSEWGREFAKIGPTFGFPVRSRCISKPNRLTADSPVLEHGPYGSSDGGETELHPRVCKPLLGSNGFSSIYQ